MSLSHWNHGPDRKQSIQMDKLIAGKWTVATLPEAGDHIYVLSEGSHVYNDDEELASVLNKDTFELASVVVFPHEGT